MHHAHNQSMAFYGDIGLIKATAIAWCNIRKNELRTAAESHDRRCIIMTLTDKYGLSSPTRRHGYVVRPGGIEGKERLGVTYQLSDGLGNRVGSIRLTSRWSTPRSCYSSEMFRAYAVIDGVTYTGRTTGFGMSFNGRMVI